MAFPCSTESNVRHEAVGEDEITGRKSACRNRSLRTNCVGLAREQHAVAVALGRYFGTAGVASCSGNDLAVLHLRGIQRPSGPLRMTLGVVIVASGKS